MIAKLEKITSFLLILYPYKNGKNLSTGKKRPLKSIFENFKGKKLTNFFYNEDVLFFTKFEDRLTKKFALLER